MTTHHSTDVKEIVFVASAKEDFNALPEPVKADARAAFTALQNGRPLPPERFKTLSGNNKLKGVAEIRVNAEDGNTYRVYELVIYKEVIYVLEASAKKSPRGGEIPQQDITRLEKRKAAAEADYKANKPHYQKGFDARERRRALIEATKTKRRTYS